MPRPPLHSPDSILDAARDLIAAQGPRSVRIEAVARASGAPVGSIYHRFGSVDELLARTWLRAARRSQEGLLGIDFSDPERGLVDAALATYDFCLARPAEALTLGAISAAELGGRGDLPTELTAKIASVNEPLESALARVAGVFGEDIGLVLLIAIDLPFGFARRHLGEPRRAPATDRDRLVAAVRGILTTKKAGAPRYEISAS